MSRGAIVFTPLFRSPDYDLVAELDGRLLRIEVKTTTALIKHGRYAVAICTKGGNQSWSGLTKRWERRRCDFLFVHCGDGRRFLIPADRVEGTTTIIVGGPKYAQFEVERGTPLPRRTVEQAASTIASP